MAIGGCVDRAVDRASAGERAHGVHRDGAPGGERAGAIDEQSAAVDRGCAGVRADAGEHKAAGAVLRERRTSSADRTGNCACRPLLAIVTPIVVTMLLA